MLEKYEGTIKNGQYRSTSNLGNIAKKTKTKTHHLLNEHVDVFLRKQLLYCYEINLMD
jgi:hypothetical protein